MAETIEIGVDAPGAAGDQGRAPGTNGVPGADSLLDRAGDSLLRGELAVALDAVQREVDRLRQSGATEALADALGLAAHVQAERGHLEAALDFGVESLAIAQGNGDGLATGKAFRALGVSQFHLGHDGEAARMLGEALKVSILIDDGALQAHVLADMGANTVRQAQALALADDDSLAREAYEDAAEHAQRGLDAALRIRDPHAVGRCSASLALARLGLADVVGAMQWLRQARELAVKHAYGLLRYRVGVLEGQALLACEDTDGATSLLRATACECRYRGLTMIEHDACRILHLAARAAGNFWVALQAHERVHFLAASVITEAAQTRARVLVNEVETRNARLEAEKARLEAELLRLKSRRLESEKRVLQAQTRELDRHANQDALTGLWNRRYIDDELSRLLLACRNAGQPLTVAIGDIDFFKLINDQHGHPTGDAVLCAVADVLRDCCRPGDIVARIGGEEFLVVLENAATDAAWQVCERMRYAVETHDWDAIVPDLAVTISIGVSTLREANDAAALLASADRNLYAAKHGGRNRVELGLQAPRN